MPTYQETKTVCVFHVLYFLPLQLWGSPRARWDFTHVCNSFPAPTWTQLLLHTMSIKNDCCILPFRHMDSDTELQPGYVVILSEVIDLSLLSLSVLSPHIYDHLIQLWRFSLSVSGRLSWLKITSTSWLKITTGSISCNDIKSLLCTVCEYVCVCARACDSDWVLLVSLLYSVTFARQTDQGKQQTVRVHTACIKTEVLLKQLFPLVSRGALFQVEMCHVPWQRQHVASRSLLFFSIYFQVHVMMYWDL